MKEQIKLALSIAMLAITPTALSADVVGDAFKNAKVDGQLRFRYESQSSGVFSHKEERGAGIGGNLGLTTAPISNIKLNFRFYSANGLGKKDEKFYNAGLVNKHKYYDSAGVKHKEAENFNVLGVSNIEYNDGTNMLKIGRQTLYTPLISSDDAAFMEDVFEAVHFSTKVVPDTTISAIFMNRNAGSDSEADLKNEFVSMSSTIGADYDEGIYAIGFKNKSIKGLKASFWYYNAVKLVDMYHLDLSYKMKVGDIKLKFQAHHWGINSKTEFENSTLTGHFKTNEIDYTDTGVKVGLGYSNFKFDIAYDLIDMANGTRTINARWGMYPEYTYSASMGSGIFGAGNTPTSYVSKTDAIKIKAKYYFNKDTSIMLSHNSWVGDNEDAHTSVQVSDIAIKWKCLLMDDAKWKMTYSRWEAKDDGENVMSDNNLFKIKYVYSFRVN